MALCLIFTQTSEKNESLAKKSYRKAEIYKKKNLTKIKSKVTFNTAYVYATAMSLMGTCVDTHAVYTRRYHQSPEPRFTCPVKLNVLEIETLVLTKGPHIILHNLEPFSISPAEVSLSKILLIRGCGLSKELCTIT